MAFRRYDSILAECLEAMREGASVESCLVRYPQQMERLRPALMLAERLLKTPTAAPRQPAKDQGWRKLEKRLTELQSSKQPATFFPAAIRGSYAAWLRPVAISAVAILSVSAVGGGTVYASQSAMPSSPLYPVKLASEDVRLWFVWDDSNKAQILLDQSNHRMEEINDTVRGGDTVPENALAAMESRNRRAFEILQKEPENTQLRARVLTQAQAQEQRLLAIWPEVPADARDKYSAVVADLHNTQLDGGAGNAVAVLQPEELSRGILTISGQAQQSGGDQWQVGGVEVRIDDLTLGYSQLQAGASATVLAARSSNGRLHALSLGSIQLGSIPTAVVSGAVEEVTDQGISVAGQWIPFSSDTLQTFPVKRGQQVQVTLQNTASGVVAGLVNPASTGATDGNTPTFWLEGTIQSDVSRSTSRWTVGGFQFDITPSTAFDARAGSVANGARVQIEAVNANNNLQARRVTVLNSTAASDTANIIGTFDGFDQSQGIWHISGLPVVPSASANDPKKGSLVIVDAKRQGADLVATNISVAEDADGPSLVQLEGTISKINGSRWTLEIGQVHVPSTAHVTGHPDVGVRVLVWGSRGADGTIEGSFGRVLDQTPIASPTPADASPTPTPFDVSGAAP
jgi:hypothetical protein